MRDIRYGFYLRPSFAMCRAQAEMHELLRRQYGLQVAGKFMPHATIKGFFQSDADTQEMVSRLNESLTGIRSFPVVNSGVFPIGASGIALDIGKNFDGERNAELQALHEAALTALLPLVSPDCDFTPREWLGDRFVPHLTIAMADIPPFAFDEILQFIRDAEPIGPPTFTAEVVNLWEFRSDDWSGHWGETLTWRMLHAWRLS